MQKNQCSIGDPVIISGDLLITRSRHGVNDYMYKMVGKDLEIKDIRGNGDFELSYYGQDISYVFAKEDITILTTENSSKKQKETGLIFSPSELII